MSLFILNPLCNQQLHHINFQQVAVINLQLLQLLFTVLWHYRLSVINLQQLLFTVLCNNRLSVSHFQYAIHMQYDVQFHVRLIDIQYTASYLIHANYTK